MTPVEISASLITTIAIDLIAVGAFYGAVKVEIQWIKRTLEKLENQLERLQK